MIQLDYTEHVHYYIYNSQFAQKLFWVRMIFIGLNGNQKQTYILTISNFTWN